MPVSYASLCLAIPVQTKKQTNGWPERAAPANASSIDEFETLCASLGLEGQCCTVDAVSAACRRKSGAMSCTSTDFYSWGRRCFVNHLETLAIQRWT